MGVIDEIKKHHTRGGRMIRNSKGEEEYILSEGDMTAIENRNKELKERIKSWEKISKDWEDRSEQLEDLLQKTYELANFNWTGTLQDDIKQALNKKNQEKLDF